MTSPLPPRHRDSRNLSDLMRQAKTNLGQAGMGLVAGRFPPARLLRSAELEGDNEDDTADDLILFSNTDQAACSGPSANIQIPLTHTPEDGSEQVFYNGTPLKRADWTRTDTALTIPGESWFRAGKVAWVDYAYYDEDPDTEAAAFVSVTTIQGDHTAIAMPGTPNSGDMLVLVMHGRSSASCSDPRFSAAYLDPFGKWGMWVGTDDGSSTPATINLSTTASPGDGAGALMRISGAPLLPVTSQAQTPPASGPFTPTIPALGSFGVAALISGASGTSGTITGDLLGHWTTHANLQGNGSGFTSVYLGTIDGLASGQWSNSAGPATYAAWIAGIQ